MRVYPEQFADHLKPYYLVFGDEPLLKLQEQAIDLATHLLNQAKF
ncbi:DNA polymerase III subunit delta [Aeromonas popoffii]|uniref:DNA polymerase III subunit delta n=1 Tax=Aeromonas popoffii TaxID=70856 RepID=A0ABS5GN52_9GAMM|nr:DNA polymerase III subunit delta [Aeromonas popoffii]